MSRNELEIRLIGLHEVAARLGISIFTARRWASTRRIPTVRLGRRVLVDPNDLEKIVKAARKPARSDIAV